KPVGAVTPLKPRPQYATRTGCLPSRYNLPRRRLPINLPGFFPGQRRGSLVQSHTMPSRRERCCREPVPPSDRESLMKRTPNWMPPARSAPLWALLLALGAASVATAADEPRVVVARNLSPDATLLQRQAADQPWQLVATGA